MTTTTTTDAGRVVAGANIAHKRELARQSAGRLNGDAIDTTTPLFPETVGKAGLATLPEPPAAPARPVIVLSVTIVYRGRQITISNDGMTLDQFCDLLDKRLGVAS